MRQSIQRTALEVLFRCQLTDGTWPLSRPLFHYPGYGNAYCYEYEMLAQLLQMEDLQDLLLEHLPELRNSAHSAYESGYRLAPRSHSMVLRAPSTYWRPESWATASVYHFFYVLDRLLAVAVKSRTLSYSRTPLAASRRSSVKAIGIRQGSPRQLGPIAGRSQVAQGIALESIVHRSRMKLETSRAEFLRRTSTICNFLWPSWNFEDRAIAEKSLDS